MEELLQSISKEIDNFSHNLNLVRSSDSLLKILRSVYHLNEQLNHVLDYEQTTL